MPIDWAVARMVGLFRKLSLAIYDHPVLALLTVAILACIGLGGAAIGSYALAEYHFQAAKRALSRHDYATAQQHLVSCLQTRAESAEAHFLAARTARLAFDYRAADKHLRACQRCCGLRELINLERDLTRAQRGDLAQVDQRLRALAQRGHPDSLLILEALSRGYMMNFRLQDAQHCLQDWLEQRPDDVQALLWRGEVEERLLRLEEALADYRHALALAPDRDDDRLHLAELLIKGRQPEEASRHLAELVDHQPEDAKVLLALARCRHLQGRTEEARSLLDRVLLRVPNDAAALAERGRLELANARPADAEPWLRQAVARAPHEREIVYAFSQCLQQVGRLTEAQTYQRELEQIETDMERLSLVSRKINASPNDPSLRHEAGVILLRNGQTQAGLAWLASTLQVDPFYSPTHRALADYFDGISERGRAAWHRELARRRLVTAASGQRQGRSR